MSTNPMTKEEIAFLLSAPRASLSLAQKLRQTAVFKALGREMPAEVKPPKAPVDRKAAAAKARATMLAHIAAAASEYEAQEAATKAAAEKAAEEEAKAAAARLASNAELSEMTERVKGKKHAIAA